jgi:hypothetical protein
MTAYDYKAVNRFASLALQKGVKTIDVIVAEYEQTYLLKSDKVYHYNIMLKADNKNPPHNALQRIKYGVLARFSNKNEISILDLKFPEHSKKHRSRAYEEAKAAMKKLKDWHIDAYALPKFVEYSWFFAKPLLDKPITNKP